MVDPLRIVSATSNSILKARSTDIVDVMPMNIILSANPSKYYTSKGLDEPLLKNSMIKTSI